MRIGITGEGGFIGKAVSDRLTKCGHSLVPLGDWTYEWGDECSEKIASEAPSDLDWVLHLGARTSIAAAWKNPYHAYAGNLGATLAALEIARISEAALVFMSSYVYGTPQYLPLDEDHPTSALNPYMGSKLLGEELCRQWHQLQGRPLVILRGFNIYGDSRHPDRLIPCLIDQVRREYLLSIEDPEPKRDYLYIKDFAELAQKIIEASPVPSGTYNVGSGEVLANREVAELVRALSKEKRPVKCAERARPNDVMDCTVDTAKVRMAFGWEPQYTLKSGLADILGISD